jgi:hypothetical protein
MTEKLDVGLLFLAHDGVRLPDIWTRWAAYMLSNNITVHVGVVSNDKVSHGKAYVKNYRLPVCIKTSWCDMSLPQAYMAGLRALTSRSPTIQFIFFVSGADIPIGNSELVREVVGERKSYLGTTGSSFSVSGYAENIVEYTQWIHVTREHADILSQPIDWNSLPNVSTETICPDEWVSGYVLRDEKAVIDSPLTDMERSGPDEPSPIDWKTLNGKRLVWRDDDGYIKLSLAEVLLESTSLPAGPYMFFRKVSKLSKSVPPDLLSTIPWIGEES